jgi:hypothetical protein
LHRWATFLGSGFRATLDALAPSEREAIRRQNLAFIRESTVEAVEANVVYAVARRQPWSPHQSRAFSHFAPPRRPALTPHPGGTMTRDDRPI